MRQLKARNSDRYPENYLGRIGASVPSNFTRSCHSTCRSRTVAVFAFQIIYKEVRARRQSIIENLVIINAVRCLEAEQCFSKNRSGFQIGKSG